MPAMVILICMMPNRVYVSGTEKVEIAVSKFKKYALPGIK